MTDEDIAARELHQDAAAFTLQMIEPAAGDYDTP